MPVQPVALRGERPAGGLPPCLRRRFVADFGLAILAPAMGAVALASPWFFGPGGILVAWAACILAALVWNFAPELRIRRSETEQRPCPTCGYPLARPGEVEPPVRCPECGTDARTSSAAWREVAARRESRRWIEHCLVRGAVATSILAVGAVVALVVDDAPDAARLLGVVAPVGTWLVIGVLDLRAGWRGPVRALAA